MSLLGISRLKWDAWLRGLISAVISGGTSAITGSLVVGGTDPEHYNFTTGKFWVLTGSLFGASALVSLAKFLQTQPLPAADDATK